MTSLFLTIGWLAATYLSVGLVISLWSLATGGLREIRMTFRRWPLWALGCLLVLIFGWLPMLLVRNGSGERRGWE